MKVLILYLFNCHHNFGGVAGEEYLNAIDHYSYKLSAVIAS